jgi:hypothetical protein
LPVIQPVLSLLQLSVFLLEDSKFCDIFAVRSSFKLIGNILSPIIGGFVQQFQIFMLKIGRIVPIWTIALFATATFITGAASAADTSKAETSPKPENTPIIITAEQLDSDNNAKFAEFSGNVKEIQADFVIPSDKLRIY